MEIERKFLIARENFPEDIEKYPYHIIEQGYLCVNPVVRVRRQDEDFILTYKGKGMMMREEHFEPSEDLPLQAEGYYHLLGKADGKTIRKKRYLIPLDGTHTIELDEFEGEYEGLLMAEVEFTSAEDANRFEKPAWFGEEVTYDRKYHNSYMSLHAEDKEKENKEEQ